jgi:hypothetical protein
MLYTTRRLVLLKLTSLVAFPAFAQGYVTNSWVYLRRSPSNTGAILRTLHKGDSLSARAVTSLSGWVPLRTRDGNVDWVGAAYMRSICDGTSTVGPVPATGEATPACSPILRRQSGPIV